MRTVWTGLGILVALQLCVRAAASPEEGAGHAADTGATSVVRTEHAGGEHAGDESAGAEELGHHAMTHPFLVHMGLPEPPGEVSVRVTGIRRALGDAAANDLAVHIEAGLISGLGLHIRNDAIFESTVGAHDDAAHDDDVGHGTEVMLMYALLQDAPGARGISVFGQLAVPTVVGDGLPFGIAAGLAGRYLTGNTLLVEGNAHVLPTFRDVEIEYEAAAVLRIVGRFFVLLEHRGHLTELSSLLFDEGGLEVESYLLPALKLGLGDTPVVLGFGVQLPLTELRGYDRQVMAQLDIAFDSPGG